MLLAITNRRIQSLRREANAATSQAELDAIGFEISQQIEAREKMLDGDDLDVFLLLVLEVRKAQNAYFDARKRKAPDATIERLLVKSKAFEKELDDTLAAYFNPKLL